MAENITKLADHQVFHQIQSSISDHPIGKGTILFANSYTGTPVDMHQKVRDVLISDDLFIGNNPINQLKKAFERLENGPWYIDCRGDALYIHNKPYTVQPVHNYVYGNENGEVISISFKTQYRTRNASRAGTMSFDQFSKTMNVTTNSIKVGSDQELAEEAARIKAEKDQPVISQGYNHSYLTSDMKGEEAYYENKRNRVPSVDPFVIQAEEDQKFNEAQKEDYESLTLNEQKHIANKFLAAKGITPGTRGYESFQNGLKEVKSDPKKLNQFLLDQFGGDTINIQNDLYRPFYETRPLSELVPSTCYIPAYSTSHKPMSTSYVYKSYGKAGGRASSIEGGDFAYSVEQFLKSNNYVLFSKPQYRTVRPNAAFQTSRSFEDVQVSFVTKQKGTYVLNAARFFGDYYSRWLSSPAGAYSKYLINNAINNTSRKVTEKRLQVEMRIIGRPSLTSSSKVHIDNVGSRSGDYIIKSCIHRIANDGYTCSLTLERGDYKPSSDTSTADISFGKPKDQKGVDPNNQKEVPHNDAYVVINPTQEELEYFQRFQKHIDKQVEIATEIGWHRYQASRKGTLSQAEKNGVYHKHITADSSGNIVDVRWTQTRAPHTDNYNDFKEVWSNFFYQDIRKRASHYERYSK